MSRDATGGSTCLVTYLQAFAYLPVAECSDIRVLLVCVSLLSSLLGGVGGFREHNGIVKLRRFFDVSLRVINTRALSIRVEMVRPHIDREV